MINTSYEPFSTEPEYLELNRQFVRFVAPHIGNWVCLVDIACGTGTLTELLLQEPNQNQWSAGGIEKKIIGVDLSRESLKIARDQFVKSRLVTYGGINHLPSLEREGRAQMILLEGPGDRLPIGDGIADMVLIGNAIHCFANKANLVKEICRVLRTGGLFAFNSSFYAGTIVDGTHPFYEAWMKQALAYLKGVPRTRGQVRPAFSNRWLSPTEYGQCLFENGFAVAAVTERVIQMSRRNFETVGAYSELASVLLSGYPVALACEALERAVEPAFLAYGASKVPRSWLEVVGLKK